MHPSIRDVLQFFRFDHLPPRLQEVSRPFALLAVQTAQRGGGAECTAALRHLLQAKDAAVRAVVAGDAQDSVDRLIASINGINPPSRPGLALVALRLLGGAVEIYWAEPTTLDPASDSVDVGALTDTELRDRGVTAIVEQAEEG